MASVETFRKIALSFPEATEQPHFEKTSFRIGKKIFASLDTVSQQACLKFSPVDQDLFAAFDKTIIFPVPNKWGKLGWTFVTIQKIPHEMLEAALATAYKEVAPKKLSALVALPG